MNDRLIIREAPGAPGYFVTRCGRVLSTRLANRSTGNYVWQMRELKASPESAGYRRIAVHDESGKQRTVRVHTLVCEAFHGPRPSVAHEVCHYDGDRRNNHADNLRWDTRKGNMRDSIRLGRTGKVRP